MVHGTAVLILLLSVSAAFACQNPLAVDGKTLSYRLGEGPSAHSKRLRSTSSRWQDLNSVDYLAPAGTKVVAIVGGTICSTCVHGKTEAEKKDKYSLNSFTLNGSDGMQYYYTHLASIAVPPGAKVRQGQVVGTIGAYNGKNPHLHLAIPKGNVCDLLKKCTPVDTRACT